MPGTTIALTEVDDVRITLVTDNSIDMLMASTDVARRLPLGPNPFDRPVPIAEHGFSALIRVQRGDKQGTVLFDTGLSRHGLLDNLDALRHARALHRLAGGPRDCAHHARCFHPQQRGHDAAALMMSSAKATNCC